MSYLVRHAVSLLSVATFVLAGLAPAWANGPDLPAGLVGGDDFLVSRASSLRGGAAIAYNDDQDEYLVVWQDARDSILYTDIYGQIVSSAGVPRGGNFVVRDEASNVLAFPDVAYDTTNQRYLVVWEDDTEKDIEGQLVDQDGVLFGSAFNVVDGTSGDPRGTPAVAFHGPTTNTYFVAYRRGTAGSYNIYGKTVSAAGSVGATEAAVCTAAGDQTNPDVGVDPATNGDFLIAWEDARTATPAIYGCLFFSTGFLGTEFTISSGTNPRHAPALAFNPSAGTAGEWLVVFEQDVSGDSEIASGRVTAAGAPTGSLVQICTNDADQYTPDVAYNASSNQYLVVWEDYRNDATADVYGRRVDAGGTPLGSGSFDICTASGTQFDPVVAASPTDPGYLVTFANLFGVPLEDISGQRVGTGGSLQGHLFAISAPLDQQKQPAIAYNSQDAEFLVVWHDKRNGTDWNIWGQRVDLGGALLGDNLAICSDAGGQFYPAVAYNLDTNQYLVVWEDQSGTASIFGQRVNAGGSLDGAAFRISAVSTMAKRTPRVTFNPISGEYLVVYTFETESDDVLGRRVPAAGNPATVELDIAIGSKHQHYPDVACQTVEPGGGGYLVVWRETDATLPVQRDMKGQRLNQTGGLLGGVLDICTQADDQWSPAVAYNPDDDRYLVVWPDDRNSATQGRNVYGRQVSGAGALDTEFAISTAAGEQSQSAVGYSSPLNNYTVVWADSRSAAQPDIYGQRVSGTGALVSANELLFQRTGAQEYPVVAWASNVPEGLVAWQDGRAGATDYHVYGLRLAQYVSFLPMVLKD